MVNPGPSGLDKRQFTLQLCIRADGGQLMPPYLIFQGGGQITEEERAMLDECTEIRCVWQGKAWADGKLTRAWMKDFNDVVSAIPGNHLLFLDELRAHHMQKSKDVATSGNVFPMAIPGGIIIIITISHNINTLS